MKFILRKCSACSAYTLRTDRCPKCGGQVRVPAPPKFSPDDPLLVKKLVARKYAREGAPADPSARS